MTEDIQVDKAKFDALLHKIAKAGPLKEDERKVGKPKREKIVRKMEK